MVYGASLTSELTLARTRSFRFKDPNLQAVVIPFRGGESRPCGWRCTCHRPAKPLLRVLPGAACAAAGRPGTPGVTSPTATASPILQSARSAYRCGAGPLMQPQVPLAPQPSLRQG